jgi:DNA repair exonuclease SbcCD ATPase subunit
VDLERYQRLHDKANARKLALKGQLEALSHQTAAVPEVSDMEVLAAANAIEDADEARTQAQARIDVLLDLEARARRWADTHARLAAAREKLRQAEAVLGEAVRIEAEYARLRELRDVLPAVFAVATTRAKMGESERRTERLVRDRADAQERRTAAEAALDQAKRKRASLQKTLAADEARLADVGKRLRELEGLLRAVKLAEDQEAELRRLDDELKRLPTNPPAEAEKAAELVERLAEVERVVPVLERLHAERSDLLQARHRHREEQAAADRVKAEGEAARRRYDDLVPQLDRAKADRAAADEAVGGTSALVKQARAVLDEFGSLAGQKSCRACGQPLSPSHFEQEKRRRADELRQAERRHADAVVVQKRAAAALDDLAMAEVAQKGELDRLRETYKEHAAAAKQAAADTDRHTRFCKLAYAELPDAFRRKVAFALPDDWARVEYPARDELSRLRGEAAGLDAAKRQLRDAQTAVDRWRQLSAKAESTRATLAKVRAGLPAGDPAALRGEHQRLDTDERTLAAAIKTTKANVQAADAEADRFAREAHEATRLLTELAGRFGNEENVRTHCRETIDREMRKIPDTWRPAVEAAGTAEYSRWKDEQSALEAKDTEARYRKLESARAGLDTLRTDIRALEAEAEAFPEDARRSPDEVKGLLAEARKGHEAADKGLQDARRRKAVLDGHREQRAKLGEQYRQADAEHNRYKILAELLGRDRLQRHLVRRAERQIVDYANAVLDRLSGGQLFLKLVGGEEGAGTDRALELECSNRVTGGSPINVQFLSGSQKFRVAVSLALGIGQYASRQHRPIESVIIDEGFGCLDRQGRQVMIQELQNLRGHLHCILLVSHQEEFADAFADGYRFELTDGATRVSRFQR